jgi:methionyl-tRNA formyltransferase
MLSALRMNEELDAGPVYAKLPLRLNGTAQEIYVRAGEVSYKIIQWMVKTKPSSTPQQGDVTIFERRVPKESRLPEHGDQRMIYDFIRMLDADGYPKAYIDYGSMRLYFDAASLHGDDVLSSVRIVFRNGHEQ